MKIHFFALSFLLFSSSFLKASQAIQTSLLQQNLSQEQLLAKPPICPEDEPCELPSPRQNDSFGEQLLAKVPVCLEDMPCMPPIRLPGTVIEIQTPIEGFIFHNDTPQVIRWIAVPGVTSYSVSIREANKNIWETIVNTTPEILYPTDLRLKPGNSYELTVQVVGDEKKGNLTFRMLSEEETQDISSQANNIFINPDLSEVEKALQVASLYSENLLFGEAMEVLLNVAESHQNSALVYRQLGNLSLNTQQPTLAKSHYQQSFNLATNSEEKAYAAYGLGMASVYEGNLEEATQWLSLAQAHYEQTGAQDWVDKITELLVDIAAKEE